MRFILVSLAIAAIISCGHKNNRPDVSHIQMNVKINRFDKDFFSLDTNNIKGSVNKLYQLYPSFLPRYFEFFSPINFIIQQQEKSGERAVLEYYRNIKPLFESTQEKFRDVSFIKKGLDKNLRYIAYYYPSFKAPAVITTVESLNPENAQEIYGTLYFNDTLVISLQMFLGKDFTAYDPTQYFDYLRRRFEPQYIVPNSIRSIITSSIYPDTSQSASLIEQMIDKGKQWYLMENFLPDTEDSVITGFTKKQLAWCKENEGNIWGFISQNDIYTQDVDIIQNYIGEAPFTQGMPEVSPGNIGQWIGWQIVKKFASKHPDYPLTKVVSTPARTLFQESGYKPK